MLTLPLAEAEALVARILQANDTGAANARSVARALVAAEADGLKGHGLSRVASYAAQARVGKVDGHAVPVATRTALGVLAIDAAHGFAFPALDLAKAELPALARAQGVAAAAVRRSHHCGAMGLVVEHLAEAGLVVLPKRWIVERTIAWLNRCRRLAKETLLYLTENKASNR